MAYSYKIKKPKRSWMNLSHENKFDTGFGTLVPILCEEILPHDTIRCGIELFTRFSALISPAFQRCDARIEFFFVPNRILWKDWDKFISNDPGVGSTIVKPYFDLQDVDQDYMLENSIFDYLGFPVQWTDSSQQVHTPMCSSQKVDILPLRAYYKIWYDFYRDENTMTGHEPLTDGGQKSPVAEDITALQTRCYPRDYFTTALPYPQQGSTPVRIPLQYPANDGGSGSKMKTGVSSGALASSNYEVKVNSNNATFYFTNPERIVAGPTIEEIRRSSAVQRWLEKNIKFGGRYVESIASHFGIHVGDYRLDRPEYLGGGKINVRISEVLQTSETSSNSPLGDEGGHAIGSGNIGIKPYTATEHGWFIALLSFVPKASYGQGWPKKFQRWEPTDFAFPEFDRLGEQELKNDEIFAYGNVSDVSGTFGYKPRYDEYKHSYDRYCGSFRSSLAFWHLGRIFASKPTLSPSFLGINWDIDHIPQTDPDRLTRMFATDDTRNIICDIYHHLFIKRPLSKGDESIIK